MSKRKKLSDMDPRSDSIWDEYIHSETRKDFETRLQGLWWQLEYLKRNVDFLQGDIPDCLPATETHSYFDLLETIYHTMDVLKTTACTILERSNEQYENEEIKAQTEVNND